jgi:hypothetical protein
MDKITRLGWADGLSFRAHGARIGIRVNDPWVLGRIPACLPPGWKASKLPMVDLLYSFWLGGHGTRPGVRNYHLLYDGSVRLARTLDLDEALEHLGSALHFGVAIAARRRLFVHAGVVGWRGRAILIPGRTCSGKTTLTAALVRAGATY